MTRIKDLLTPLVLSMWIFCLSSCNSVKILPTSSAPGGMHRFSCSIGKVDINSEENWVRLANYSFDKKSKVWESHWHWTQRKRVRRSYTGVVSSSTSAPNCEIRTADSYEKGKAPHKLQGTYKIKYDILTISWNTNDWWEKWKVEQKSNGELAMLTFVGSNFGATNGWGFGSNASWEDRIDVNKLLDPEYSSLGLKYDYRLWKVDDQERPHIIDMPNEIVDFPINSFMKCQNGPCIAKKTTSRFCGISSSGNRELNMYISLPNKNENGRRNTWSHWCQNLSENRNEKCYRGNSHVKPLIQIIDNKGKFRGWVGVEASINESTPNEGVYGDDIGIFVISDVLDE